MQTRAPWLISILLLSLPGTAQTFPLDISLHPDAGNPASPTMGDQLVFHSVITNTGQGPAEGIVAWISLVEVTPGREQPMDLEDWSAHKAVAGAGLDPGGDLATDWPMRLIQSGDYRVVISATDRAQRTVNTSPALQFHVNAKPVLESSRILPVSLGTPALIAGWMGWRRWRRPGH